MSLDECDRLIQGAANRLGPVHAIFCLFTGPQPPYCEPMLRDPAPATGWALSEVATAVALARRANAAIEDGAILFGRGNASDAYRCAGLSYRLFPPAGVVAPVLNKGSAFNSCLSMSIVAGIDGLYQMSQGAMWRFVSGSATQL